MAKKACPSPLSSQMHFFVALFFAILSLWGVSWCIEHFYQSHFLPRTSIGTLDISNTTFNEASAAASLIWCFPPESTLTLIAPDYQLASSSAALGFKFEIADTLQRLFDAQKQLSRFQFWQYLLSNQSTHLDSVTLSSDYNRLSDFLATFAKQTEKVGHHPSITINGENTSVDPGSQQIALDWSQTFTSIQNQFPKQATIAATLIVSPEFVPLSTEETSLLEERARALIGKSLIWHTDKINNYTHTFTDVDLIPILLPKSPTHTAYLHELFTGVNEQVARPPQEPEIVINEDRTKVTQFSPPLDGLTLDEAQFITLLLSNIDTLITSSESSLTIELPLITAPPTHTLAEINDLGISEVIGFGESYYAHSSAGRAHNVAVAASQINGTLVAPGEEFSFNRSVGDVSAAGGYQEGYIIQSGRSVLSAGGGVCQVSTTVFRALLDAGLKITLRRPHSYRVSYYELSNDPGFDATVFSGNVDLRFINDTDHYVLITTSTDSNALYMYAQIWGTSDGRYTTITNYQKFNASGAPPAQYIEDPSLAPGQVKQIDWAVGGLETNFTHTIYNADGSIRSQKDYPSKYQAWSAKYLVGPSN